jgi:hypothetical protein
MEVFVVFLSSFKQTVGDSTLKQTTNASSACHSHSHILHHITLKKIKNGIKSLEVSNYTYRIVANGRIILKK